MLHDWGFSPAFDNIFTANTYIANVGEEGGGGCLFIVLLYPTSRYRNTDVWTFLKLMIMIEHIKMMQMPHLHIWSMLFSGQVPLDQFKSIILE